MLIAITLPLQAFQGASPFSGDFTTTLPDGKIKTQGKIYFSPPRIRIDLEPPAPGDASGRPQQGISMIADSSTKTTYVILHQQHAYIEVQGNDTAATQQLPMFENAFTANNPCAAQPDSLCTRVGSELVNNRSCDKWEVEQKDSGKETLWVDQKLHFPIKSREADGTVTSFTNLQEGPQDASLFQVPAGYKKMSASDSGKQPDK